MYPQIPKTNTKHNGGKKNNDNFTSGNMSCVPLFNVLQETSRLLKKMILITIRTMMLIVMVMLAMMLLNSSHLSIRRDPQWVGHPRPVPHLHKEDYLIVPPFCDHVFENIWKVFRWENRSFSSFGEKRWSGGLDGYGGQYEQKQSAKVLFICHVILSAPLRKLQIGLICWSCWIFLFLVYFVVVGKIQIFWKMTMMLVHQDIGECKYAWW